MASPLMTEFAPDEFLAGLSAALDTTDDAAASQGVLDTIAEAIRSLYAEAEAYGHSAAFRFNEVTRLLHLDRGYFVYSTATDRTLDREQSLRLLALMEENLTSELEQFRERLKAPPHTVSVEP